MTAGEIRPIHGIPLTAVTRRHTLAERQLWGGGDTALVLCPILNPGYNYTHGQDHCPVRKAPTHKICESSSSKSLAGNTFGSHSCCLNKRKKITAPFKPPLLCNVIHQIISNCLLFITVGPKIWAASKLALVPKCILLLVKPSPRASPAVTVPHSLCQLEVMTLFSHHSKLFLPSLLGSLADLIIKVI